jgi:peptidyl-prolyl cis-trans isomerase C
MLLLAPACSRDSSDRTERPPSAGTKLAPRDSGVLPPRAGAVAEVNGIPVTREEFLRHIDPYPARMKETMQGREYVLKALVDHILLEAEAKRLGLDRDPDFVKKVESYRRNLLTNKLLDTVREQSFEVTPEEARAYFDAHPDEFDRPERFRGRHILLATEDEAKQILDRIRSGASFEQMAREHSRDSTTKQRGGDLGVFTARQRPDLAEAFSQAKPGQVAGPIHTQRGFHLIQLIKRFPPEKKTFATAQESLATRLRARKRQETKQELLDKLREAAQVKIYEQELEKIQVPVVTQ